MKYIFDIQENFVVSPLLRFFGRIMFSPAILVIASLVSAKPVQSAGVTLFEDNFNSGVMSPEWVTIHPTQWVQDGWLHTKDLDGWPRDSQALVHDRDQNWRDYSFSLDADFVPGTSWENFAVV
ncbi:MAG: hypothetical protein ACKOX2_09350, partial [Microcystaceae cyanobacterium]